MNTNNNFIKKMIMLKKDKEIIKHIKSGWDPNDGGGWPIRLAARHGCSSTVETLVKYGANPHLLSESGASTLQLAVYSGKHWESDQWSFLLSCCDSSQLADGAAVAIIFTNCSAFKKILETGRCNVHIPTTLTGKTIEELAKGYQLTHLLFNPPTISTHSPETTSASSPSIARAHQSSARSRLLTPEQHGSARLSPSVASFFQQTASQTSLRSPQRLDIISSPTSQYLN